MLEVWIGFVWLGIYTCEHGNASSGSVASQEGHCFMEFVGVVELCTVLCKSTKTFCRIRFWP